LEITIKSNLKIQNSSEINLAKITTMHYSHPSIYLVQSG
jgi:hypothetical protein